MTMNKHTCLGQILWADAYSFLTGLGMAEQPRVPAAYSDALW